MPESPFYFIAKGKKKEALHALQFLRGQSSDSVQDEFTSIQNSVEEAMQNKGSIMDIIKNKGNLKALIICCGLLSFQQLSGINVVLFNSQTIFDNANSGLDPAVATILVGIVQVIASGCTPLIATRLGRKTILMISAAVMCVGLVSILFKNFNNYLSLIFLLLILGVARTLLLFGCLRVGHQVHIMASSSVPNRLRYSLLHWIRTVALGCTR